MEANDLIQGGEREGRKRVGEGRKRDGEKREGERNGGGAIIRSVPKAVHRGT